jgi:hypothetical protein
MESTWSGGRVKPGSKDVPLINANFFYLFHLMKESRKGKKDLRLPRPIVLCAILS